MFPAEISIRKTSTLHMKIPIAKTNLIDSEIESVLGPLKSGWLVQGPHVHEFESRWCEFTGAAHSIAVTSCTSALHLSLVGLGIGPGDEVIVPAFTWIATANVVEHVGARVVFCDVDPQDFNLDVSRLESCITTRTRAIIPVHLFGLPVQMEPIKDIAGRYNLAVIEDAACGFGARYNGSHVGTLGRTGCFSFHPRKSITTGEGGMITTEDKALAEQLRRLRDHGAVMSDLQRHLGARPYLLADHSEAGFNQRMTDIQAALGSAQMLRSEAIIAERQRLASRYTTAFKELLWLRPQVVSAGAIHGYQSYACMFEPEAPTTSSVGRIHAARNQWMDDLLKIGISTRPATHAVHMLSYYRRRYGVDPSEFLGAFLANECSIAFPLYNGMTDEEQDYVINAVLAKDA